MLYIKLVIMTNVILLSNNKNQCDMHEKLGGVI